MLTTAARPRPAPTDTDAAPVAPAARPRPAPRPKPPLRVVTVPELTPAARRARARLVVFAVAITAALSLFGVVVAHVLLMQGQFELEGLHRQAAEQQAEYDRLRLEVAELESPDHIVATAQEKLGMVVPPTVRYLAPSPDAMTAATPGAGANGADGGRAVAAPSTQSGPSTPSWATVKPHLDEG